MEAVVAGRDAGSRFVAGRLVLDRLCRLYDLFADFVSEVLRPSLNDWASALGMLTRNAVHRIRMFLVFICNDYRSSKFTNVSPNLRKKSELLYYNDENLMFASLVNVENT